MKKTEEELIRCEKDINEVIPEEISKLEAKKIDLSSKMEKVNQ